MKKKAPVLIMFLMLILSIFVFNTNLNDSTNHQKIINDMPDEKINSLKSAATFYGLQSNLTMIMNISSTTGAQDAKFPNIAVDSQDIVHAVWQEEDGDGVDIWYSTYNTTNPGAGWSTPEDVSASDADDDTEPDIYLDDNDNPHVVWIDGSYNVKYRNKTTTWNDEETVYTGAEVLRYPVIAVSGTGRKMVVWTDLTNYDIYYSVEQSFVGSSSNPLAVSPTDFHREPKITCDSAGNFHVVYYNRTAGGIYKTVYCNYSSSLNKKYYLSDGLLSSTEASYPDIIFKDNMIIAAWSDKHEGGGADKHEIVYRNKTRTGAWQKCQNLTTGSANDNIRPRLARDSEGKLWITWIEDTGVDDKAFLKTPSEPKITLTIPGTTTTDGTAARCSTGINNYNSIFSTWDSSEQNDVLIRKLDRYGPQIDVLSPTNGTIWESYVNLNSTAFKFDFKNITYSYWNDTNEDGIPNGGDSSSWKKIYTTSTHSSTNYTWDTTGFNIPQVIIRTTARDINGLEDTIYRKITIDDVDPNRSKIVDFTDKLAHNSSEPHNDKRFTDNITVRVNVSDNNSGVDKVELRSSQTGSTILASNSSINSAISTIKLESKTMPDGTYDFFIRTFDKTGNYNDSDSLTGIIIDNTRPVPNIKVNQDEKFTNGEIIEIDLSAYPDTANVSYYYYFTTENASKRRGLGTDTDGSDGWNYTVNFPHRFESRIVFQVNATDLTGLTSGNTSIIYIDNVPPVLNVETRPDEVGYSANIKISFGKDAAEGVDTVTVAARYREAGAVSQEYKIAANITNVRAYLEEHPDYQTATSYYVILECKFFQIQADWNDLDLVFRAKDTKGLVSEEVLYGVDIIKDPPSDLVAINSKIKKYNITLSWEEPDGANEYLIYQSLYNIYSILDLDSYNLLNVTERIDFLQENMGYVAGDGYCIARVSFSSNQNASYMIETDGPNTYYFVLIPLRSGNPGKAIHANIIVSAENPDDLKTLPNPTELWVYFFGVFIGLVLTMNFVQVKRIKVKFFKGKVRRETSKIMEKELAKFESESFDLDSSVEMERSFSSESAKIKKKKKKKKKEAAVVSTAFESPGASEEEQASFEDFEEKQEAPTIDKCPTCGWILSSTATKCPRCGWVKQE